MFIVYHILNDHPFDYGFIENVPQHLIKYSLNTDVSEWLVPGTFILED